MILSLSSRSPARRAIRLAAVAAVLLCALGTLSHAQAPRRLTIAAASDLQTVLPAIVRDFERSTSVAVTVSYGSSGTFFAQIQNGAPFDVFLSADVDYPRQLASAGLADPATLQMYAVGRLVLWVPRESTIDLARGVAALADARVRYISIANPLHAPYGRAAVAALRSARLYDTLRPKIVTGSSVTQAAQLVESGQADAGFLARSLAMGPALQTKGKYVDVPASLHPPIEQAAIVIKASRDPRLASAFVSFLRSNDAARQLAQSGFLPPRR